MVQIIKSNGGGGGGGGASYTAGTGIEISAQNEISVDEAVVQTVGNMVDNLTGADDDHYPTAKAVADAISGGGSGDVVGPNSSTDEDVVVFDGTTGKLIKDSGVKLSSKLDASALSNNNYGGAWQGDSTHTPTKGVLYDKIHTMDVEIGNKAADNTVVKLSGNQTINGTKTFGTSPVVPSKSTAATNSDTAIATEAQVKLVADDVATINGKIPSAATSSNQLADKDYVNDGINSVTAYYITKNAQGDQWATRAELFAATTFYSGGVVRVPTKNDYTIVLADEQHDNATTRYIYNSGWEYQYTVNETALTQAQLNALNSGITSEKVTEYDGLNTKTFYLSSTSDLTNAQAAYDWYLEGKNPIVVYNNQAYVIYENDGLKISFRSTNLIAVTSPNGAYSQFVIGTVMFRFSSSTVLTITQGNYIITDGNFLRTDMNYVVPYTPQYNGSPATKKYVDDKKKTITVTLTTAGWSSSTQTVTATGVTASNTVIVSPAPSSISDYTGGGVYCSAQGSNSLTFTCDTTPSSDITVNVVIMS